MDLPGPLGKHGATGSWITPLGVPLLFKRPKEEGRSCWTGLLG